MAITSVGYDGTVDEKQFEAIMGYSSSSKYGVNHPEAFAASSVAGQVLQVRLKDGIAWTAGVVDIMDASETVQLSAVTSGSRWDMIVLRRDYQPPGGNTSLRVIKGGSSMVLPTRQTSSGIVDDQPLWLVKIESRSGQSVIAQYVDLRVWARNGGCTANHDLVRSYMNSLGTAIEINGVLWLMRVGANGQSEWVKPIELALAGDVTSRRLRLTATNDASATSKDHAFQIGPDNGLNLIIDNNEIMGRNNGRPSKVIFESGLAVPGPNVAQDAANKGYVDSLVDDVIINIGATTDDAIDDAIKGMIAVIDDVTKPLRYGADWVAVETSKGAMRIATDGAFYTQFNGSTRFTVNTSGLLQSEGPEGAYNRTYATAPNMVVTSNGVIGRSTASSSLREYKKNIRPAALAPAAVLALEPVIYDRKDGSGDNELGLIAQDVEKAIPQLALYEDGKLEGVRYDRVAVALLDLVKEQQEQIAALTDRLDKLEGK